VTVLGAEAASRRAETAGPSRPAVSRSVLLGSVFVLGFLLVSSVFVVRGRVLDAGLYSDALVHTDAYERVYTEVLADPELAELQEQLLGGLRLDTLEPSQVRVLTTSLLRLSLPPSTLRDGTEAVLAALLAYLRGDSAQLNPTVDVTEVLGRITDTAAVAVGTLLADVPRRAVSSVDEYRTAVESFAARLASGRLPAAIPVPGGGPADPLLIVDVILDETAPDADARLREQVVAAVLAHDEGDALINAASGLVTTLSTATRAEVQASLGGRHELDVVAETADRAGQSRAAVVDQLNTVRDAARWFDRPTALAGLLLMVSATAGLLWLHRREPRRAASSVATAAVVAGLVTLAVWTVVLALVEAPLAPATATGPGSWGLPAGVRSLVADLQRALGDELAETVRTLAVVPIAAGLMLVAGIFVARRVSVPSAVRVVLVGSTTALVAVVAGLVVGRDNASRSCNGHVELCDRPYDEVVYAATHNSMSSPDVVLIWPEHDGDIRAQLDQGVRALLIDTHYWTSVGSAAQLTATDPYLSTALAAQVFGSLGQRAEPRDGTFLCHNQCALGAAPLVDTLADIREFLVDNPDEVVTLIIQDAITPADTADAFGRAGLDSYLHTHEPGSRWASLGELIDRDERLVVFAEARGSSPAWYHDAFAHMQETPYFFQGPDDFSCVMNRGDPAASLFLMNHWVQRIAPDRADAVNVNRRDAIVDRALECERERGQMPNYVAVNFSSIGDLIGAVDTLNGVRG
jgi:hypothetical protein